MLSYAGLSAAFESKDDFAKALEYYKLFKDTNDKLFNREKSEQIAEMHTKYETERKERDAEIYRLESIELEKLVEERTAKLARILDSIVLTMGKLVETRDSYTANHQQKVSKLSVAIAEKMGMDEDKVEGIRIASIVHDIGKIYVPEGILAKTGKLLPEEFNLVKLHPKTGYETLRSIEFPWPIADMVYQHHERMDGSGYPLGLKSDDILIEARIIGVVDVVEAMASHRPYRPALGIDVALDEIKKNRGNLYDNDVVDACIEVFRDGFEF